MATTITSITLCEVIIVASLLAGLLKSDLLLLLGQLVEAFLVSAQVYINLVQDQVVVALIAMLCWLLQHEEVGRELFAELLGVFLRLGRLVEERVCRLAKKLRVAAHIGPDVLGLQAPPDLDFVVGVRVIRPASLLG